MYMYMHTSLKAKISILPANKLLARAEKNLASEA